MARQLTTFSRSAAPVEGQVFGTTATYRLKRRLGSGGFGEVWLAERLSAGGHTQQVAVKFLHHDEAGFDLDAEALRVSSLSHDNVVPFVDSGRTADGQRRFIAMVYVEGPDLTALRTLAGMDEGSVWAGHAATRIPDPIVGFVIFMVLRALHHAHTFDFGDGIVGLVHRDVSPGNILVDERQGFVKLTDFGISAHAAAGHRDIPVMGKIPYLPPEAFAAGANDPTADLYSLGAVAYELITGFNPHLRTTDLHTPVGAITTSILAMDRPLRPPGEVVDGVSPALSRIVARLLEPEPSRRYASADAVLADVGTTLYDRGVGPTTETLAGYLKVLRGADLVPGSRLCRSLQCLSPAADCAPVVRPARVLTADARADLESDRHPARVGGEGPP